MIQTLTVNGDARKYGLDDFPHTVAELVASLALDPAMVVAEVNGDIIRREQFASHALNDGDAIELVRFVGGG